MNTTQTTKTNAMDLLTAGEREELMRQVDRAIAQEPNANPAEVLAFMVRTAEHMLSWRKELA